MIFAPRVPDIDARVIRARILPVHIGGNDHVIPVIVPDHGIPSSELHGFGVGLCQLPISLECLRTLTILGFCMAKNRSQHRNAGVRARTKPSVLRTGPFRRVLRDWPRRLRSAFSSRMQ